MKIEFVKLRSDHEKKLVRFFDEIVEDVFFHPHEFTLDKAHELSNYAGKDCYYIALDQEDVVGYGMLRGWEEGFEIPSLGIIVGKKARGCGLGRTFMHFLHKQAIEHGADSVRLTVKKENKIAKSLYESLGYVFSESDKCFIGHLALRRK